jgi:DNA mismatch endonuclease, patch repair protein
MPKSNLEYWVKKIKRNKERDKEVNQRLQIEGWEVIRIWEWNIKKDLQGCVERVLESI